MYSHSSLFESLTLDVHVSNSYCQGIINPCAKLKNIHGKSFVFHNPQASLVFSAHMLLAIHTIDEVLLRGEVSNPYIRPELRNIYQTLLFLKNMLGKPFLLRRKYKPNDTYVIKYKKLQRLVILLQVLYIIPDEGKCQIIQFLPNIMEPKSRFCRIFIEEQHDKVSEIHMNSGVRRFILRDNTQCPFFVKGANNLKLLEYITDGTKLWKSFLPKGDKLKKDHTSCNYFLDALSGTRIPDCPNIIYMDHSGVKISGQHHNSWFEKLLAPIKDTLFPIQIVTGHIWQHVFMPLMQILVNTRNRKNIVSLGSMLTIIHYADNIIFT